MRFRPLPQAAASLAVAAVLAIVPPARAEGVAVTVDFAAAHDFAGIGAELWARKGTRTAENVALLRDINAKFARVGFIPQLPDDVGSNLTFERARQLVASGENPQQRANLADIKRLMDQAQVKPHLVFWHMPEAWEDAKEGKAGKRKGGFHAQPQHIGDYATLLTAEIEWVVKQGIEPFAVELTNEPQGNWDSKFEPQDYADLVVQTRRSLDAHGLQRIRIEGPGTGVRNWADFSAGLRQRDAMGSLAFLSAHVYQSPQMIADPSTPGYAEFLGKGRAGTIFITEFGVKKHNEADADAAAGDLDVDSVDYALATGAESIELLGLGASAVIYWQLQDYGQSKKLHGMLDEDGRRRPVAAAVQALYGKLPADSRTVAGTGGPAQVPVEGFAANGRVWLLMANLSNVPQAVTARIAGTAAPHGVAAVEGFAAGGPSNTVSNAAVHDGVFSGTLAPRSLASVALQ